MIWRRMKYANSEIFSQNRLEAECDQNNWLVVNSVIHAVSICRNPIGKERLFTLFLS